MGIEAGRDQDQLGLKLPCDLFHDSLEHVQVGSRFRAGGNRDITITSFARSRTSQIRPSGFLEQSLLMKRQGEDRWIFPKDLLRAISGMNIPVDDQNALDVHPVLGIPRGDGHIVEHTESHGPQAVGVMSWRPHGAKRSTDRAVATVVDRLASRTGSQ